MASFAFVKMQIQHLIALILYIKQHLPSFVWFRVFVFVSALENFWGRKYHVWIIILSFNRNEKLLSSVLNITSIFFFFWKIIWACHLLPQHNWTHNYYVNVDFHMLPKEHRPFGTGDFWNINHLEYGTFDFICKMKILLICFAWSSSKINYLILDK